MSVRTATADELLPVLHAQWTPLVRLATLLVDDPETARDVVQDCYEAVLRLRPEVAGEDHLTAYLRRAVVNRSRSALRRRHTVLRYLAKLRPHTAPPADRDVLTAETHRELLGALDRLPTRQREVLVLRYYCDLTEADIAHTLGIPAGTVKSTAHRALATLRRRMEDGSRER
ncbi:SigE family RNA polymerase sigma factor [Amycolatopsis rhabdoformis]|uniref:SigE family RNA polymerase sigma factor n=1 Tax=Amycolatopsis rhabdoformis TaxID=1448059 RepID=A0ABZ1HY53_9PSEU|nr:SigE family RNA polymerase sigma factor [Amycolatopsis rhabdoformis]WSE27089.1 SigE family RNA polymerase sigma factor [Amycolatopsis rhabdoformis]